MSIDLRLGERDISHIELQTQQPSRLYVFNILDKPGASGSVEIIATSFYMLAIEKQAQSNEWIKNYDYTGVRFK